MKKVIIYPSDDSGNISVIHPILESGLNVEQIAAKDVPAGKPYRIIDASELPADRQFRGAWEADFSEAPINLGN